MNNRLKTAFTSVANQLAGKFVDIMALIIAMAAVIISVKQSATQTKIEILNKQPLLFIKLEMQDRNYENGFILKNIGFGPALIKSFKYYKNESDYQKSRSYRQWLNSDGSSKALNLGFEVNTVNNLEEDDIIKPDTEIMLLGIKHDLFPYSKTAEYMGEAIIEIEYESLNPIDDTTYYLRYCDDFTINNVRKRNKENYYENKL